jgi:hypothetical protein
MPLYMPPGSPIPQTTFAALPPAAPLGAQIYVTDIGEYGAVYTGNGTKWSYAGSIEVIQKGKGWIVPALAPSDTATYSQTGNIITVTSAGHNIPATTYDSKDVYLEMGTAATGATIPPGWFSNFQRVTLNEFTCVSAVSQTGTGTVKTNLAVTPIPETISTIPGGVLGLNGALLYSFLSSNNNSAGTKYVSFNFGAESVAHGTAFDIVKEVHEATISNRNNEASQALADNATPRVTSVNTATDMTCSFSLQCLTGADYVAVHSCSIYILPS